MRYTQSAMGYFWKYFSVLLFCSMFSNTVCVERFHAPTKTISDFGELPEESDLPCSHCSDLAVQIEILENRVKSLEKALGNNINKEPVSPISSANQSGNVHDEMKTQYVTPSSPIATYDPNAYFANTTAESFSTRSSETNADPSFNFRNSSGSVLSSSTPNTLLNNETAPQMEAKLQYTPLQMAVASGNLSAVKTLLSQGHPLNERNARGETALHVAATAGHSEIIEFLLTNRYDRRVDIRGPNMRTALMNAAEKGNYNASKVLLRFGAWLNYHDVNKDTALSIATREEFIDVVKLFVNQNGVEGATLSSALIVAVNKQNLDVFKLILQRTSYIDAKTTEACLSGIWNEEVFWALADKFSEDVINSLPNVPRLTVAEGHCYALSVLRAAGVIFNPKSLNLALYDSATKGNVDCIKELLKIGANANPTDRIGVTPLYAATRYGHVESIRILLEAGADPNQSPSGRFHTLDAASAANCVECVTLLLDHGAKKKLMNWRQISKEIKEVLDKYP